MALSEQEELELLRLKKKRALLGQGKGEPISGVLKGAENDPTTGMSGPERFAAGYGKVLPDLALGAGGLARDVMQMSPGGETTANQLGLPTPGDVAAVRGRDAPLMSTPGGFAGNVAGNIGAAAPSAGLPGGATIPMSAIYGGLFGAMQPAESGAERTRNALMSGGMSGAITGGTRGLLAAGPALVYPFTGKGQTSLALDAINRFAHDPGAVSGKARGEPTLNLSRAEVELGGKTEPGTIPLSKVSDELIPGSRPSLAEVTGDPGIAQLQRAAQAKSPEVANLFAEAKTTRIQARKDALRTIAGDDYEKAYFEAAREQTAKRLYGDAFKTPLDAKNVQAVAPEVKELLNRPSILAARKQAIQLAKEEGEDLTSGQLGSIKGLHYTKVALDDQIGAAKRAGDDNLARLLLATKDKLVGTMQKLSPKYAQAMSEYQAASKPISRMEIGRYLYEKLVPAASDVGAERLTPQPFIKALRDGDKMAQQATGFKGARLADILSTQDMETVVNLAKDLGREIGATEMAKVAGSPTAQYLAAGNAMRQVLGPLGLPESWVEKTIGQTLANWGSKFPFNVAEERVQTKLGEMLVNPQLAREAALRRQLTGVPLSDIGKRLLPPVAIGVGSNAAQK